MINSFSCVQFIDIQRKIKRPLNVFLSHEVKRDKHSFQDVGTVYLYRSLFYLLMVKFWNTTPLSLRIICGLGDYKNF